MFGVESLRFSIIFINATLRVHFSRVAYFLGIEMSKTRMKLMSTAALAFLAAAPVAAQDLSYAGVTYTTLTGTNSPGSTNQRSTGATLDAGFAYALTGNSRIAVEGTYTEWATGDDGDLFYADAGAAKEIAIHYLRDAMSGRLTYGGFVAYGSTEAVDGSPGEVYEHLAVGLEGVYEINSNFTAYAQVASVDAPSAYSTDSFGYDNGMAYRIGGYYTGLQNTTLFLDYQFGDADRFEDASEPGDFERIALGGETHFGDSSWSMTYSYSSESYLAVNDGDVADMNVFSVGFRYYFGDTQSSDLIDAGMIGTPEIIRRVSLLPDTVD